MDLTRFYQDKNRLSYNPKDNLASKRTGIKKFIAFEDRFVTVAAKLEELINKRFNKFPVKILDIGIGDAVYESLLLESTRKKIEIYGIDISQKQLSRAKEFIKEGKVVNVDHESLPYKPNFFNIVLISELLEHVFYPEKVVNEAKRVLKEKGYLIITYPNSGALQLRLSLLFFGRSPLLNYSQNKEHIRFFSKKDIMDLVDKELRVVHFQGLGSFLFGKWNFPLKIITPRFLQVFGNKFLKGLSLGHLLILKK